jgi:hypothetical protein
MEVPDMTWMRYRTIIQQGYGESILKRDIEEIYRKNGIG